MPRLKGACQNESVTFRIKSRCLDRLRKEAEHKEISINTLVNQILSLYINWHSNAANAGFTSVKRGMLARMMEKISEEDMEEIAEYVARTELRDMVLLLRSRYDLASALDVFDTWYKVAGFSYHRNIAGNTYSYLIQHNLGMKYSIYLRENYRSLFEDFGVPRVQFNITDKTLSFEASLGKLQSDA